MFTLCIIQSFSLAGDYDSNERNRSTNTQSLYLHSFRSRNIKHETARGQCYRLHALRVTSMYILHYNTSSLTFFFFRSEREREREKRCRKFSKAFIGLKCFFPLRTSSDDISRKERQLSVGKGKREREKIYIYIYRRVGR